MTFGGPTSVVEVRLTAQGDSDTVLELEHTAPIEMAQSGAGALYVGPRWDGALMGLDLFLRGEAVGDPVAAAHSLEVQEFSKRPIHAGLRWLRTPALLLPSSLLPGTFGHAAP